MSSMKVRKAHERIEAFVPRILADLLRVDPRRIKFSNGPDLEYDLAFSHGGRRFVVEVKSSSSAAHVALAARQLAVYVRDAGRGAIPLVAVPFMGEAGKKACEEAGVGWFDLAGNARISAGDLFIVVEGRPNPVRSAGRRPDLFSPKSSRVIRWLLQHPDRSFTQREIARGAILDEGYVSRIVRKLESEAFLLRDGDGSVRAADPNLLLDAWRERYRFSRHEVRQGHVPARSGVELLKAVAAALRREGVGYAATGLAAAWMLTEFAAFRIATIFLEGEPPAGLLASLHFRDEPRGGNLWLVFPDDDGVFHGALEQSGVRCAHPVQVYLDLKGHPERANEAAEKIREEFLTWIKDA